MGVVQEKMYMNVDDVCEILGVSADCQPKRPPVPYLAASL